MQEKKHTCDIKASDVERQIVCALRPVGFEVSERRPLRLAKSINGLTEVFIYPGVQRKAAQIIVNPVIGTENVILRERLRSSDLGRKGATRVCHAFLGLLASWNQFCLTTEQDLADALPQLVKDVLEIGLPTMSEFDSLEKVRSLFRQQIAGANRTKLAVLFADRKLSAIADADG